MDEVYRLPFEKLEVWEEPKEFVKKVYRMTKQFPKAEQFGLVSQINRAAISVSSNLAEGSPSISRKDQARFSELGYGSLMEVACQLKIAQVEKHKL